MRRIKALMFTGIGVAIMLASVAWAVSVWGFAADASSAQGIVTRLNAGASHPQVRFTTAAGEVIEYPQNGWISGYQVGDQITVLYDPQRPTKAVVNTFGALWGFTLLGFTMGAAFVGMAQLARHRPDIVT
jgi:hypothetical protein